MIAKTDMSSEAVTHRLKQMEGLWLLGTALKKVKVVSKGTENKNRGLEIQAAIRNVLFTEWNPISFVDEHLGKEYDAYIAPLYRVLATSRDREQLIDTLIRIERDEMGIAFSDPNKLRSVADSLLELSVTLDQS